MPVAHRAGSPASTTCSIAVSAPSSWISANANGRCERVLRARFGTHVHVVTTPACPTSTKSLELLAGLRVVLLRRHEHASVARADAQDPPLLQAGEEAADDRPVLRV